ncbi:MAG: VCBS repeat-containing protein, partial [Bacteroidetes bacterium]
FLLANEGGEWVDITPEPLKGIGMVTDACWADLDGDQDPDLLVVGDWMPVQVFINEQGRLSGPGPIPNSRGWWTRIQAADLDQDGDPDFVLGNWGLNTKLKASPQRPLQMYVNDFDANGKSEFIICWYPPLEKQAYPFATKAEITAQMPSLKKQILRYETYATQTYETLFPPEIRQQSIAYTAENLHSSVLWNEGGSFSLQALPVEAQVAPVFGIVCSDFNQDGQADIWLGGNFYGAKPQVGRYDASRGVLLTGKGGRAFEYVPPAASGIEVSGEVRDAALVHTAGAPLLMVSRNNEEVLVFQPVKPIP